MNKCKALPVLTVILFLIIFVGSIPVSIVHAAASSSMSVSGSLEVGSVLTVNINVSGTDGPYFGVSGTFLYDSSYLRLDSISQGNYTSDQWVYSIASASFYAAQGSIPSGTTVVSAKFTCLTAGSTTISLSDFEVDGSYSSASKTITITTPVPKSSNANLASLQVSPGSLSPAFSASTQSYSATVAEDQTKITVSATAADSKAKVSLNGVQKNLVVGTNSVKITVTAENGTTKIYTITVTRTSGPTPTPTPTSPPLPLMIFEGTEYTIMPIGPDIVLPDGFIAGMSTYQDVQIPVIQKVLGEALDAKTLSLVLLGSDTGNIYFVYDQISQTIYPYQLIASSIQSFLILGESVTSEAPVGYEGFDYAYLDTTVHAYRLISDPENVQIILYMMDDNGIQGLYYYDTLTGMIFPYRGEAVLISVDPSITVSVTPTPEVTNPTQDASTEADTDGSLTFDSLRDYRNPVVLVVYLISAFCLILLIVLIVMIFRKSFPYQQDIFGEDIDYSDQEPSDVRVYTPPEQGVFYNEFPQPTQQQQLQPEPQQPPEPDQPIVYVEEPVTEQTMPVFDFPVITRIPADQKTRTVSSTGHVPVRLQRDMDEKASLKSRDDASKNADQNPSSDDKP